MPDQHKRARCILGGDANMPGASNAATIRAGGRPAMRRFRIYASIREKRVKFLRDCKAASAVEFALVASPFILLLLAVLQSSVYFMAQFALDTGVTKTAQTLRNNFTTGTSPVLLTASQLKSSVVTASGGLIANSSSSAVEIRQLTSLDSAATPIVDGTVDYGSTTSVLVLRARAQILNFAPGFSALGSVQSSAIVRRQGT